MKTSFFRFVLPISKINVNHLRTAFMILVLIMLVLGAGAPEVVGGSGT